MKMPLRTETQKTKSQVSTFVYLFEKEKCKVNIFQKLFLKTGAQCHSSSIDPWAYPSRPNEWNLLLNSK